MNQIFKILKIINFINYSQKKYLYYIIRPPFQIINNENKFLCLVV